MMFQKWNHTLLNGKPLDYQSRLLKAEYTPRANEPCLAEPFPAPKKITLMFSLEATPWSLENKLWVESSRKGAPWILFDDYQKHYTKVIAILGRECREWAQGETNEAVEAIIIAEMYNPGDTVVFTDGSLKRSV